MWLNRIIWSLLFAAYCYILWFLSDKYDNFQDKIFNKWRDIYTQHLHVYLSVQRIISLTLHLSHYIKTAPYKASHKLLKAESLIMQSIVFN